MDKIDFLTAAIEALDEVDIQDDKPLVDFATACALVEIATQLRLLVAEYQREMESSEIRQEREATIALYRG